jgi:hypothetical protein
MANATAPYLGPDGWTIDVDPDDINFIVWDVTKDLTDRATTPAATNPVTILPTGITITQGPTVQGTVVIALVKMASGTFPKRFGTMRMSCANGEQFDRTIYFNTEDH